MRRLLRALGTVMVVAGLATLTWALVVWRWEDPFTSLYTRYEQRQLGSELERRIADFAPPRSDASGGRLVVDRAEIAALARRYRREARRGDAIGRLRVPRMDLDMVLVNGTDSATLERGPGRDPRTYMPGEGELVYVAGHRTTYAAPFSAIDSLQAGDRVTIELPYATFVYRVTRHVIVPATDIDRLRSRGREVLALQACHPRFFASHRYIVYAQPVRIEPRGGTPYAVTRAAAARD